MSNLRLAAGANQTRGGSRIVAAPGGRAAVASRRPANVGAVVWQGLNNPVLPPWQLKFFSIRQWRCASKATHKILQNYEPTPRAETLHSRHCFLAPALDFRRRFRLAAMARSRPHRRLPGNRPAEGMAFRRTEA